MTVEGLEHVESLMPEKDYDTESLPSSSSTLFLASPSEWDNSNYQKEYYDSPSSSGFLRRLARRTFEWNISRNALPWLQTLTPSFLYPRTTPRKVHQTSWLDGLRGLAAFFVYIHHFILVWFPNLSKGYGSEEKNTYNFFQWPFIRIIYSGRGMVAIFFVISGYVLSYSALRKIRNREFDQLLDTLASSTFRRGIRLYIPVLVASFMSLLIFWYQLGDIAPVGVPGPGKFETFKEQLKDWWWYFILITNPVQPMDGITVFWHPYTFQLWTIPREFRGSIIVYLTLLCFAKTTQAVRLIGVACLAHYFLWIASWDLYLFLIGILFAEIHLIQQDRSKHTTLDHSVSAQNTPSSLKRAKAIITSIFVMVSLFVSLHLLCYPDENASTTPGYLTLNTYTPLSYVDNTLLTQRLWVGVGATLLLFILCFFPTISPSAFSSGSSSSTTVTSPILHRLFVTPIVQYLGDISYALYVTHAHVIFTVGKYIFDTYTVAYAQQEGADPSRWNWGYIGGFCVAVVVNTIGCVWLSDLFWRGVDVRSVSLARKAMRWCWIS